MNLIEPVLFPVNPDIFNTLKFLEDYSLKDVDLFINYNYQVKEIGLPASRIAVQFNPSGEGGLDIMGQVFLAVDDNLNAVKFFQMALESNPVYAPAHYHLGIYYSAFDDIERAVYHLQQALMHTDNPALFDQAERLLSNYQ